MTKTIRWIARFQLVSLITLNLVDAFMTYVALFLGASELNPLFNAIGVQWIIPFKMVVMGIIAWAGGRMRKKHPAETILVFSFGVMLYAAVALWHALQMFILMMWTLS